MWIFIILLLTDIYIFWRLVADLKRRSKALQAVVFTVKAIQSLILLYFIVRLLSYKGEFADPANVFRYQEFGALAALVITVGSLYLVAGIGTCLLGRILHRRIKGLVLTNIIISGALLLLFTDSFIRQRFDTKIVRQEVAVTNLDSRLDGMKIVLISDLHLSSWHGHYDRLAGVVNTINAEKPDLLINAGDFITFGWQEFGSCDTILRKAGAVSGAFAIYGNHDDGTYHPGYNKKYGQECYAMLSEKITASGYSLLSDTTVLTGHNGAQIAITGIVTHGHHLNMRYGNFKKAFDLIPDSVFSLLLVHDPDAWDEAAQYDRMPQLALAGHTHGMQAGLPVPGGYISPASIYHKRWRGLYSKGDKYLYVTTGMGTMGMALRIFMPPEIVVITLSSK
jgi:predicted MPP superfamily phosphohydrolase